MSAKRLPQIAPLACACALLLTLLAVRPATGQDSPAVYPRMAPLNQYFMADRNAEIALARSAAPPSISAKAKVLFLGRHGYQTAAAGENGFVCLVERGWMAPFNAPEFWNPKIRGPICYNPPAARSILPIVYMRTQLVLAGKSKLEVKNAIKAALDGKKLPALEPGGMSYMMSKQAYLTDSDDHNMSHLMFYTPPMSPAAWGADLRGSQVMLNPQFNNAPEPIQVFMVPLRKWSDGTPQ